MSLCELLTHTLSATASAFAVRRCLFDRLEREVKHVANTQRPLCAKIARLHGTLLLLPPLLSCCCRVKSLAARQRKSDYLNAGGDVLTESFSVAADANLGNNGMLSRTSQRLHSDCGCSGTTTPLYLNCGQVQNALSALIHQVIEITVYERGENIS